MLLTCPHCSTSYEVDAEHLPAKFLCTNCDATIVAEADGSVQLLQAPVAVQVAAAPTPVVVPKISRPQATAYVPPPRKRDHTKLIVTSIVLLGAGALAVNKEWRDPLFKSLGLFQPEAPPVQPKPPEPVVVEVPKEPVKTPEPVIPKVDEESIIPDMTPTKKAEPEIVKETTLEDVAPDVARAYATATQKILASPASAETEARNFLKAMYTLRDGKTYASGWTEEHPAVALQLFSSLWDTLEQNPGATLPQTTEIKIRPNPNKSFDLTETYLKLCTDALASVKKGDQVKLASLAKDENVAKLLVHFAKGQDSSTPDNALTFGRMLADIRKGKQPLEDAGPKAKTIDELPAAGSDVDLADFKDVKELVKWAHALVPTNKNTVKVSETDGPQIQKRAKAYLALPAELVLPHPTAGDFPGKVHARAPRAEREVIIDTAMPGWHPTGLYAPPGEVISLKVPGKLGKTGYKIRIGACPEDLAGGLKEGKTRDMRRFPIITNERAIEDNRMTTANPFGGEIFITVPYTDHGVIFKAGAHGETVRGYDKAPKPAPEKISIAGAVEMPWMRPGMPTADWLEELKKPAPRAELDFGLLRMSVRTEDAKKMIRHPSDITKLWQTVMDAQWKFGGFPGIRVVPMRIAWDRQVAYGYMHSGYPIAAPEEAVNDGIDYDNIKDTGSWGLFHEIGHNHQPVCITAKNFTETTVNLFTLAAQKAILPNRDPILGHDALNDVAGLLKKRRAGEEDAFTNLAVYVPLIQEFGFESLTKTMQVYWKKDLGADGNVSNPSEEERKDVWVRRFGEVVERDVSDFFQSVHFEPSAATRRALARYPKWDAK